MWYHHDQGSYMSGGWGVFAMILWLLITVDLVLLGIWLWQKIQSKK